MFDLDGKAALVTGASGGIGGAIAQALHERGAILGLSGTRTEALEERAAALGERAHVLPCNLSDAEATGSLVRTCSSGIHQNSICPVGILANPTRVNPHLPFA